MAGETLGDTSGGGDYGPTLDQAWGAPTDPADGWSDPNVPSTAYDTVGPGANLGPGTTTASVPGIIGDQNDYPSGSTPPDFWSALGPAFSNGLNYLISRDAAKRGLVRSYSPTGQPLYQPAGMLQRPITRSLTGAQVLLIGGLAILALAVAHKG